MISRRETPPSRGPVALVKIGQDARASLQNALELSQGLAALKASDQVLIKPNLVGLSGRYDFPAFGMLSTTLLLEALIQILRDCGVGSIAVGDGSLVAEDMQVNTRLTMERLDYPRLAQRYGIELIDLNEGTFVETDLEGLPVKLNQRAVESDFLISLPALKTHSQCKVTLSLKNLKGCLHLRSKAACHGLGMDLDRKVALMARALYPDLAIIDGRYALARGPLPTGEAMRTNLLIAAQDALAADLVGAEVLGYPPQQVPHLVHMAGLLGRKTETPEPVGGLNIEALKLNLPYTWDWDDEFTPEPYSKYGVRGVLLPKYDASLCTGCSLIYNPIMVMSIGACAGKDMGGIEILTGKARQPSGRAERTVLMGNCMIKHQRKHPHIKEAILVKGCPPSLVDVAQGLNEAGIPAELKGYDKFMASLGRRYTKEKGFLASDFALGENP